MERAAAAIPSSALAAKFPGAVRPKHNEKYHAAVARQRLLPSCSSDSGGGLPNDTLLGPLHAPPGRRGRVLESAQVEQAVDEIKAEFVP